jgi:hypothetical protein
MVVTAADGMVVADLHLGIAPLRVGVIVGGTPSVQETKIPCRFRGPGAGRRLAWSRKECSR